jgi:hypothetical protein
VGRCGQASTQGQGLSGHKQKVGQNAEKEEKEKKMVFFLFYLEQGFNNFSRLFLKQFRFENSQILYINLKILTLIPLELLNVSQTYYKILLKLYF